VGRRKGSSEQLGLDFTKQTPPRHAPYERKSDTSKAAADSHTTEDLGRLESLVLERIRAAGDVGMTDDEIEVATGLPHQTASARRRGLVLRKAIIDSDRRRPTRHGRNAVVWILVPPEPK